MESNVHKWDYWQWGSPIMKQFPNIRSMDLGKKFLADCKRVEDWGCGDGFFKVYRSDVIGVDGSNTPGADKKYIDLVNYVSDCDGIFIRHVLEHNYEWKSILKNAINSARFKVCVVMFIPFSFGGTIQNNPDPIGVPNLSISEQEFFQILKDCDVKYEIQDISAGDSYEKMIYITK
jgi:hypothetical protein